MSMEVLKARGEFIDATAGRLAIEEIGADWIRHEDHLRPSSALSLEIALTSRLVAVAAVPVSGVQFSKVQNCVSNIDGSATKVIRAYGVFAAILNVAVRDRRILSNPARGVKLPQKTQKEQRYL